MDSRESAAPGALGALLSALAPDGVLPVSNTLEVFVAMHIGPSPDTLPVAKETIESRSPAANETPMIEPESSSPAAEGVGGAALSQDVNAQKQRYVARLCAYITPMRATK